MKKNISYLIGFLIELHFNIIALYLMYLLQFPFLDDLCFSVFSFFIVPFFLYFFGLLLKKLSLFRITERGILWSIPISAFLFAGYYYFREKNIANVFEDLYFSRLFQYYITIFSVGLLLAVRVLLEQKSETKQKT